MIISALIVVSFIMAGRAYGKQEIYFKVAVAKDVAFLIDSLYSTPGDVEFIYPQEMPGFGIKISDNKVTVFKHSALDSAAASYSYAGINDKIDTQIECSNKIMFLKKGEVISLKCND